MQKFVSIVSIVFLFSCGITNNHTAKKPSEITNSTSCFVAPKTYSLKDKTIKFLWSVKKHNESQRDSFNTIVINEDYCKTITDPERAALGYVATFIGNECWWDGNANDDRSNLKCKILTSLNLGYQCSDKHLGFLLQWFKNDKTVLEELKDCPTTPYTSTIQDTFDEITLTVKGDTIRVWFKANGVNMREQKCWSWSETDYFKLNNSELKLIKKDESNYKYEDIDSGE
jgi:hypothetical protein